jgi:hypothetical protein
MPDQSFQFFLNDAPGGGPGEPGDPGGAFRQGGFKFGFGSAFSRRRWYVGVLAFLSLSGALLSNASCKKRPEPETIYDPHIRGTLEREKIIQDMNRKGTGS